MGIDGYREKEFMWLGNNGMEMEMEEEAWSFL